MPNETAQVIMRASEVVTKTDFEAAFKKVLELIEGMNRRFTEALSGIEGLHKGSVEKLGSDNLASLQKLEKQVDKLFVEGKLKEMDEGLGKRHSELKSAIEKIVMDKMRAVDDKMARVKDGERGIAGPPGPKGEMPTEHLELLKEFREELQKVKKVLSDIPRGKAMGRAKVPMPRMVDLTADQNGAARTFTIPQDTDRIFGALSSQFPFVIAAGDISRSGNQITLDDSVAPRETGQTLLILTDALFYP